MTATPPLNRPLDGLVALVTGASRGIGRASAIGLAEAGAQVIVTGRTQGALEDLDSEIKQLTGQGVTIAAMDLAQVEHIDVLGGVIHQRWGKLDIMLHAAAQLGDLTPVSHIEPKAWDQVIHLNYTVPYRLIRSLEPLFKRAAAARPIFVTTGVSVKPRAFWGTYASSKAGMDNLIGCWADELENTPVRPCLLNPGPTRTRMRAQAFPGEDPTTLPEPAEIAPLVVELARPDLTPPARVDFRDWRAARAEPG